MKWGLVSCLVSNLSKENTSEGTLIETFVNNETAEKVPFRPLQKGNVKEPEYKTRLNTC